MVVDGLEPDTIKDVMELEIEEMERRVDIQNQQMGYVCWHPYKNAD